MRYSSQDDSLVQIEKLDLEDVCVLDSKKIIDMTCLGQ